MPFLKKIMRSVLLRLFGTIVGAKTQQKVIALTFDDGPHPLYTPKLLSVLNKHNAKATFFALGKRIEENSDLVRDMVRQGHEIGCHSWDHPSFPLIPWTERLSQVRRFEKVYRQKPKYFRPPYGDQSLASYLAVRLLGYRVVGWSKLAEDWLDYDSEWLFNKLRGECKPGNIVLLHDSLETFAKADYVNRQPTIDAVDKLLSALGKEYKFVTVSELLATGRPQWSFVFKKPNVQFLNELSQ